MSRVLLIEPDAKLAHMYRRALELRGHTVTTVAHAQDAVFAADAVRPDVVVLELLLAGHGGVEFLYEFRSYAEWQRVPVILLTLMPPHTHMLTREAMEDLGIVRNLYKPAVTLGQLCSVVDDVVAAVVG